MLNIQVISFSFKKGYPSAAGGNGGGFVFDCRFLENPGRYEPYKKLSGKDKEVIEFLQSRSIIDEFLDNVFKILKPAVINYLERDFNSLQVCFGCTGGQHRSVYSAEKTAEFLKKIFPEVNVELIHREQSNWLT